MAMELVAPPPHLHRRERASRISQGSGSQHEPPAVPSGAEDSNARLVGWPRAKTTSRMLRVTADGESPFSSSHPLSASASNRTSMDEVHTHSPGTSQNGRPLMNLQVREKPYERFGVPVPQCVGIRAKARVRVRANRSGNPNPKVGVACVRVGVREG